MPPPGPAPVNGDTTRTLYASRHEDFNPGSMQFTTATPWMISTDGAAGQTANLIITLANAFAAALGTTNSNGAGAILPTSGTSWATYNDRAGSPDASFTNFVGFEGIEDSFSMGVAGTRLDLFRILDYTTYNGSTNNIVAGPQRLGTNEGYFTITQAGQLTFHVIPEPGSALLAVVGGLGVLVFRRARPRST